MQLLSRDFYQNTNPFFVGEQLIGKIIETSFDQKVCTARIVELEIYKAPEDRGSHAYQNKLTDRTKIIFEKGGLAYVYLCYGIHHMFNVVSGPEGVAHAILIRAVEPLQGIHTMKSRRGIEKEVQLTNGPGKLCQALGIKTSFDGETLFERRSKIRLLDDGFKYIPDDLYKGPRVGIAYAKEDANLPYRYYLKQNSFVSRPLIVKY